MEKLNIDPEKLRQKAADIIAANFGSTTGAMYREFYSKMDTEIVLASLRELLTENLGANVANEYIVKLEAESVSS